MWEYLLGVRSLGRGAFQQPRRPRTASDEFPGQTPASTNDVGDLSSPFTTSVGRVRTSSPGALCFQAVCLLPTEGAAPLAAGLGRELGCVIVGVCRGRLAAEVALGGEVVCNFVCPKAPKNIEKQIPPPRSAPRASSGVGGPAQPARSPAQRRPSRPRPPPALVSVLAHARRPAAVCAHTERCAHQRPRKP